jgi:hypothetical protein
MAKTIGDFEKERNIMLIGDVDPSKEVTQEEFDELVSNPSDFKGVFHEDRAKFLKNNGYDATRANMLNADLSAKEQ